ncbi:hypothetical protein PIB30_066708 [Stylosanthes scabra]|uniref:BAG family molecular chaperone regulator 1 n=1 Tax=Stylosanthes scabra TaxID=79078 RepID=A0ABU6VLD8_9FABA|nr:hypothetical protein [Stylosanthes scabra]
MMRMRNITNNYGVSGVNNGSETTTTRAMEWEMRPGGMLVQRRTADSDRNSVPPAPTIRVRVKYGSTYHELNISSQATFGELKKMLSAPTGLHHQDQKIYYKDKERDSKAFLDIVGVKDKSKLVLVEDPLSQERRYLEMRKNAKMEKAANSISQISLEVDRLAGRVSALESIISKGGKVAEIDVISLIELLMNQLLKLDGIMADGDVKLQRKMQVKRVQKYVETLDMLKIKNSIGNGNNGRHHASTKAQQKHSNVQRLATIQEQPQSQGVSNGNNDRLATLQERQNENQPPEVVVTTKWETFDSLPPLIPVSSSTSTSTSPVNNSNKNSNHNSSVHHKFNWEFFD